MHKEILTDTQIELLPALKRFREDFGLVGGTAVALHIGHRESVDFDLFPKEPEYDFHSGKLLTKFRRAAVISDVRIQSEIELTFFANEVKVTFFDFGYRIPFTVPLDAVIHIPDLLTLAAMKAFAFSGRAKWKDYVDFYFIMRDFHSLTEIKQRAAEIFGSHFNERLLREQLAYFDDINYDEPVVYKEGFAVPDEEVKAFLEKVSVS